MDFQFAPWERLTSDVTDGDADARIEVEGKTWLYRRCGNLHFAHPLGQDWNYLLRRIISPVNLLGEKAWEETDADRLPLLLQQVESSERMLGRYWQLEESVLATWSASEGWHLHWHIGNFLARDAGVFSRSPMIRHIREFLLREAGVPFRFSAANFAPSSAVFAALQAEWHNDDSDLNYSARFLHLGELERALLGVQTQIGTPQEWAVAIAATARACGAHWPENIESTRLNFCANGAELRFTCETNPVFGARERAILGHIMRVCQPQQLPDDPAFPCALRTLTEGSWSRKFSMEIARPSMHEQLEAALTLRPWLQAHWPDGVKHLGKIV